MPLPGGIVADGSPLPVPAAGTAGSAGYGVGAGDVVVLLGIEVLVDAGIIEVLVEAGIDVLIGAGMAAVVAGSGGGIVPSAGVADWLAVSSPEGACLLQAVRASNKAVAARRGLSVMVAPSLGTGRHHSSWPNRGA